jgi:hypothetical protein
MTPNWMPIMGTELAIRGTALDNRQALKNHGQSLWKLAERGGVSPAEALAIAERREFSAMPDADALTALALMMSNAK